MDALDGSSAEAFQTVRAKLQTGPWNTGQLGEKGYVVSEVLNATDQSSKDGVKRYTDRYSQRKTIGRTIKDFPFNPAFLPPELYKPVGLTSNATQENGEAKQDRLSRVERLATMDDDEKTGDGPDKLKDENANDDENENDENGEDVEDEFEELDDDDYNAEKYFDDGDDDDGDADDGDGEAAY